MAQITSGLRGLLAVPWLYDSFQRALGADRFRRTVARIYIRAAPGERILDIGCGTAQMLSYLPACAEYIGVDLSPSYIEAANSRFGTRGVFRCMNAEEIGADAREMDVVIAIGLLHHLDDKAARTVMGAGRAALKAGGRMVTVDPTIVPRQSRIARALVRADRGQNVRDPDSYRTLAEGAFSSVSLTVKHDLLRVPYSHCILECTR